MKPGSWLEVSNPQPEVFSAIWSQGYVEKFILKESADPAPQFPFLILVESSAQIKNSQWQRDPLFQGFLLRAETVPQDLSFSGVKIWFEIVAKDFKQTQATLEIAAQKSFEGLFLLPQKMSLKNVNRLIERSQSKLSTRPHDLRDNDFESWEKLECFANPELVRGQIENPEISVIIPHYENHFFLSNVLSHLEKAFEKSRNFEVIIVDDESSEKTFSMLSHFILRKISALPVKLARWPAGMTLTGQSKIFRAGASRNWGATLARAPRLFFLDADMLVPTHFTEEIIKSLANSDVVQFVRKHIPRTLSHEAAQYADLINSTELYVEESSYWNDLFEAKSWPSLQDYWKYTCTYALAIKRETFFGVGRIRRNFIRYGFEDTDLGYRLHQKSLKFEINKTPLLHLTSSQESTQNIFFRMKKLNRIQEMAKVFYKLHLNPQIYKQFQAFLD